MSLEHSPELFQRPTFLLSECNPIIASLHDHPGTETPLFDMHYELELGVVLEGRMRRFYQHEQRDCGPGDVWFCGMWEPHGYGLLQESCRVLVLVLWPPLVAGLHFPEAPELAWMSPFTCPPDRRPAVAVDQRQAVLRLAERMLLCAEGESFTSLKLRLALVELLMLLLERAPERAGAPALELYERITPALELVFQSHVLITNDEAAESCAMSSDQFARRFQHLMGISFPHFALRHRIRGAADALARTGLPVKAIAGRWGFTDASHLHRLFQQHYGCSPTEYRARLGGNAK